MAVIIAPAGDTTTVGTSGNDVIYGTSGDQTISGGTGNDVIYGGTGNDMLYGGAGNDWIYGGAGNDTLKGGAGMNSLTGGAGADQFVFRAAEGLTPVAFTGGHGVSTVAQWLQITDLTFAQGDVVRITGFDNVFSTLGLYHKGTGSYWIETQADVQKLADFLKANPSQGFYFDQHSGFQGTTFILNDGHGHQQALTLDNIHVM